MGAEAFVGGGAPLADKDQLGGHDFAFLGLAKPQPASAAGQMENAVIAGRHIETNGPLGAIDALRQAGHSALKRLERPCRIVAVAPCLEPAFRTGLMMLMRSRPAVPHR